MKKRKEWILTFVDLKSYFPRKMRRGLIKRGMLKQLGFSNEIRVAEIPLFFFFFFSSMDFVFYFPRVRRGVFQLRKGWYLWGKKVCEFNVHQLVCHVLSRLFELGKVILIKLILLTANPYFILIYSSQLIHFYFKIKSDNMFFFSFNERDLMNLCDCKVGWIFPENCLRLGVIIYGWLFAEIQWTWTIIGVKTLVPVVA